MTTEAQQKSSVSMSAERVPARLRPAAPTDAAISERTAHTAAVHMRRIAPAEFNTAMIHFYRGEVQRSNT